MCPFVALFSKAKNEITISVNDTRKMKIIWNSYENRENNMINLLVLGIISKKNAFT